MSKERVLAGIRPTGNLHLGNYLGAIKGMIELQDNDHETLYTVVDVHALTTPYDHTKLNEQKVSVLLDYLAAGLDPKKSILFFQSMVPQHLELQFYFSSVVTVARMQHLPTFKDKVKQHPNNVTMALLNYPVLMAADILIYKASSVPVGIDQEPHLEVAREIARKMNANFEMDFPEPHSFRTPGAYVPSLLGEGKMSKSIEGSYINLTDDLATIKGRLARVPTDSGKGEQVPTEGSVANLLKVVELVQGVLKREEYEEAYVSTGIRYSDLKAGLAEAIFEMVKPIQEKRSQLEKDQDYIRDVVNEGAKKARVIAQNTVDEVKEKMGLSGILL